MDLDIPENPLDRLTPKHTWGDAYHKLPELKAMFEETRKKGNAGVPTVLHTLKLLKENIQTEERHRRMAEKNTTYQKGDPDPETQKLRTGAVERITSFLKKTNLEPKVAELDQLRQRRNEIEENIAQAIRYPEDWGESRSGFLEKAHRESREILERINFIETSPEFIELREQQATANKAAWEQTLAELTPAERELVGVEAELHEARQTLREMNRDGTWKKEAEMDGSHDRLQARIEQLQELQHSLEHDAARDKAAAIYEKLRLRG